MPTLGISLLIGFAVLALVTLAPRRYSGMPLSERAVMSLLRLAAWIERIATAMDAGLLRYRLERATLVIEMESTRQRIANQMGGV